MNISLENILGLNVKITNVLDISTQGKIYSFNSNNNTITLVINKRSKGQTFKIIKTSFIKHLELLGDKSSVNGSNGFKKDYLKPSFVDLDRVQDRLAKLVVDAGKKDILLGKGVSTEGQFIFDSIHKIVSDAKWQGKSIIVLNEIEIVPPYQYKNIRPLRKEAEAKSKDLIGRIVKNAWNTLEGSRKGG